MKELINNKILLFDELVKKVDEFKKAGKTIVQTHGIFDLIHPGILMHLNLAKKQGDILIVTIVKDKDVRKGPGRPIFPDNLRVENVASLEQVDYVCSVDNEIPFECVKKLKPDVFAKGQAYRERDRKIHEKIFEAEKELYFGESRIYETNGFSFSSSLIIKNFLDIYPEETTKFLKNFSKRYSFDDILKKIKSLQKLKVLLIGDGIIDEYHYCESMGKSPKAQLVVNKYLDHEIFMGGVFAIANHIAGVCDTVKLVSLLGKDNSMEDYITNNLKPNIATKFFYRDDGPTVTKKRYINRYQNQKIFEVNYINENYINGECESDIIDYLEATITEYDVVLISDFGHGFITDKIIRTIEKFSKKMAVNTQTNGANAGYNLITKYNRTEFVCLDVSEARLATQDKVSEIEDVAKKLSKTLKTDYLIITLGNQGSIGITKDGEINRTTAFSTKVVDIVGAGDAFFAYTAPCFADGLSKDLISFIGNAVGALAVQTVCNKKAVEKYELLEFIHTILK
jgi:rfaE bifunctional protein kinase chain/domain